MSLLGIFYFFEPPFLMRSTLTADIQQMLISDQDKLLQAITSHIDSIHIKYNCFMHGRYGYIDH